MIGSKTPKVLALIFVIFSYSLVNDATAQETMTITVPAGTKVIETNSSHCEPIYNESTGSLYVPRCWHLKQKEEEAGPVGRIVERSVAGFGTTVENKVQNGINRQIYEIGKTIDKVLCTSGC